MVSFLAVAIGNIDGAYINTEGLLYFLRTRARTMIGGDMYRPTDRQGNLFDAAGLMTPEKRAACAKSWAGAFREHALPILLKAEPEFAIIYDDKMGRPNICLSLIIGLMLLKEMRDMTDMEVLEDLEFDLRWMYAFNLEPQKLDVCQKTLHNFRTAVIKHDKAKVVFRKLTDELIARLDVKTSKQRLDSTHILSNFAVLSRLGLFCETLRVFLHAMVKAHRQLHDSIAAGILRRYSDESRYHDARKEEGQRRLAVAARDLYRLVEQFKEHRAVSEMNEYKLLARLLSEQCDISQKAKLPKEDDDDKDEKAAPVEVKQAKEVKTDSLQTPHDESVTYSGHKGKGFEVQIVETCGDDNSVRLITEVEVTPSCKSDNSAFIPLINSLEEAGHKPEDVTADTGYSGGKNASEAAKKGINLCAPAPAMGKPVVGEKYEKPAQDCPTTPDEARQWLKEQEAQPEFKKHYAIRAGCEATNSELKRAHGLGKLRVRGGQRVKLAVYFKAAACNLKRALRYWSIPPVGVAQPELALGCGVLLT